MIGAWKWPNGKPLSFVRDSVIPLLVLLVLLVLLLLAITPGVILAIHVVLGNA